jgi:hypothetical protein
VRRRPSRFPLPFQQSGKTANLQTDATFANVATKQQAKQQTRQQHNGKQKAPGRSFIRALSTSTQ